MCDDLSSQILQYWLVRSQLFLASAVLHSDAVDELVEVGLLAWSPMYRSLPAEACRPQ